MEMTLTQPLSVESTKNYSSIKTKKYSINVMHAAADFSQLFWAFPVRKFYCVCHHAQKNNWAKKMKKYHPVCFYD